jgi:dTDP-4-dehydrorhamnose reductase
MVRVADMGVGSRPLVVLGAGGMLAAALADALRGRKGSWIPLSAADLDITCRDRVRSVLEETGPGVIINCASYTDVDGAESEPQRAFEVNGAGAGNVAEAASRLGALIVHISTDYVFDGSKEGPYSPEDGTNPLNVYGASKLEGENRVREKAPEHLIIRTSWLFGLNGKNFVQTMLQLGRTGSSVDVVNDQRGAPTYTPHLAGGILDLIQRGVRGTWHLTNTGSCTWWEFAGEIYRQRGMDVDVNPVPTAAFPRPAHRPRNSVLDCLATYGILGGPLPSWKAALGEYLEEVGKSRKEEA